MKIRGFLSLLTCLSLIALGLAFFSCKEAGETTTAYTVTFDANGGSGTAPAAMTVNEGSSPASVIAKYNPVLDLRLIQKQVFKKWVYTISYAYL